MTMYDLWPHVFLQSLEETQVGVKIILSATLRTADFFAANPKQVIQHAQTQESFNLKSVL